MVWLLGGVERNSLEKRLQIKAVFGYQTALYTTLKRGSTEGRGESYSVCSVKMDWRRVRLEAGRLARKLF